MKKSIIAMLVVLLVYLIGYAASWIITCGIFKLVTMCFDWTFKWSIATGIWLIICVLKTIFTHNTTVKTK